MQNFKALIKKIGEVRLRQILESFYQEMASDILIGYFFDRKDLASIAARQGDFILKATQLRREYSGKAPQQAHLELPPILTGHFDRRLRILESILSRQGLNAVEIQTWIRFEENFRNTIVRS